MKYITFPAEDERVQQYQDVGGVLFNELDLQVYILANDGKYYLQDPVQINGIDWLCPACGFGDANTQIAKPLYILLVKSNARPHSPRDDMPFPVLDYVRVERGG